MQIESNWNLIQELAPSPTSVATKPPKEEFAQRLDQKIDRGGPPPGEPSPSGPPRTEDPSGGEALSHEPNAPEKKLDSSPDTDAEMPVPTVPFAVVPLQLIAIPVAAPAFAFAPVAVDSPVTPAILSAGIPATLQASPTPATPLLPIIKDAPTQVAVDGLLNLDSEASVPTPTAPIAGTTPDPSLEPVAVSTPKQPATPPSLDASHAVRQTTNSLLLTEAQATVLNPIAMSSTEEPVALPPMESAADPRASQPVAPILTATPGVNSDQAKTNRSRGDVDGTDVPAASPNTPNVPKVLNTSGATLDVPVTETPEAKPEVVKTVNQTDTTRSATKSDAVAVATTLVAPQQSETDSDVDAEVPTSSTPTTQQPAVVNRPIVTPTDKPKPLPTVDVTQQVMDKLDGILAARKHGSVTIHLEPRELGSIIVTVRQFGGKMEAEITASNDQVRQNLEAGRTALQQSMESKGVALTQLNVESQLSQGQSHTQNPNREMLQREDFQRAVNLRTTESETTPPPSPRFVDPNRAVDMVI
jgi:flagellar hook-length control protein FliK